MEEQLEGPDMLNDQDNSIPVYRIVPGLLSSNADESDKRAAVEAFVSRHNR